MFENYLHAGVLTLFVALCLVATTEVVRENATVVAAQRAALLTARQGSAPRHGTRVAERKAGVASAAPQSPLGAGGEVATAIAVQRAPLVAAQHSNAAHLPTRLAVLQGEAAYAPGW